MRRRTFLRGILGFVASVYVPVELVEFAVKKNPPVERLGWVIYEEIGTVVVNDYAAKHANF